MTHETNWGCGCIPISYDYAIWCQFSVSGNRPPIGKIMLPDRETVSYEGTTKLTTFDCTENDAFARVVAAIVGILVEK